MKFCAQDLADEIPVDITREVNQLYTVSNRLFSSKCGIKDIDLDKNESIFIQMWGKKYRFGQKYELLLVQMRKICNLCSMY